MATPSDKKDYTIEAVLESALTPFRMALSRRVRQSLINGEPLKFTVEEFDTLVDNLYMSLPETSYFEKELDNVRHALEKGSVLHEPNLSRPELQFLWGATLHLINANKKHFISEWPRVRSLKDITDSDLWRDISKSTFARDELSHHSLYAQKAHIQRNTLFNWSPPGSFVRFDPKDNTINVDLATSLLLGMEHSRALMFDAIGRSWITMKFPESQRRLREEIVAMRKEERFEAILKSFDEENYKKMRMLAAEWELRNRLTEAAENNAAHRFTANMGRTLSQDYSYSLNHTVASLTDNGENVIRHMMEERRQESLKNIFNAVSAEADQALEKFLKEAGVEINDQNKAMMRQLLQQEYNKLQQAKKDAAKQKPDAGSAYMNIVRAVDMMFFKNNGLFPNTVEGWHKIGVRPEWIRRKSGLPPVANDNTASSEFHPDFIRLMKLCGADGLEGLQPDKDDRSHGRAFYRQRAEYFSDRRNEIIETIWDEYIDQYMDDLKKQMEDQIDQEIENHKNDQDGQDGQDQDDQDGQDQNGQDSQDGQQGQDGQESQSGQDGQQSQDGQDGQQSQDGQDGQQSQDGQDGQQGEGGQKGQQNQDGQQQQGPSEADKQKMQEQAEKSAQEQDGSTGDEADQEEGFDPAKQGLNKDDEEVDVDLENGETESMPDVDVPPETPQPEEPVPGEGQEQDGQNQDGDDGKPDVKGKDQLHDELDQAKQDAKDAAQQAAEQAQDSGGDGQEGQEGDDSQGDPANSNSSSNSAGEGGKEKTLNELAQSDWANYRLIVAQLRGYIMQVARILDKVRERQLEVQIRRSDKKEIKPEAGELKDRFDFEAHRNLIIKKLTGQEIEERDLERFWEDEDYKKPTDIDVVLMIDGSYSMVSHGDKASPLQIALLSSTILYEAARVIDANVYVMMWGQEDPVLLARPGDDQKTIARRMDRYQEGLRSGTDLSPAFHKMIKIIAEDRYLDPKKKHQKFTGMTHFMVISDGDINNNDKDKTKMAINTLFRSSKYVTIDFAIIDQSRLHYGDPNNKTAMENVAREVRADNPAQKIGVAVTDNVEQLAVNIVGLLYEKIRRIQSFTAVPRDEKRKSFKAAKRRLGLR